MDMTQPQPIRQHLARTTRSVTGLALAGLVVAQALGLLLQHSASPPARPEAASCCDQVDAETSADDGSIGRHRHPAPDATAEDAGGIAARLYTADGEPVPGDVFYLMATAGSDAAARLYDDTPYTHTNGTADDTHESNLGARATASSITATDVELLEFTSPPGGGPSGGLTYTIAYLNVLSDGAFTGDLRAAATGRIDADGYVDPINAIDEKTAAASLAGADVLFTPSAPSDHHLDTYGVRDVGEVFRPRHSGDPLHEERLLGHYRDWGADRPDGMDVVYVDHIADVAAYLCGAGSAHACEVEELLADTTTEFASARIALAHAAVEVAPFGVR